MDNFNELKSKVSDYNWYHNLTICEGLSTGGLNPFLNQICEQTIELLLKKLQFQNKKVIDIGCRDGLFSRMAELNGASKVIGVDNDLSKGAVEWLFPFWQSKVEFQELNTYDLSYKNEFDINLSLGILYHLKFPFYALKKWVDSLVEKGILVISTVLLDIKELNDLEIIYCHRQGGVYPTLFNQKGLVSTLNDFGCKLLFSKPLSEGLFSTTVLFFQKDSALIVDNKDMDDFYYQTHDLHSSLSDNQQKLFGQIQTDKFQQEWQKLISWQRKL